MIRNSLVSSLGFSAVLYGCAGEHRIPDIPTNIPDAGFLDISVMRADVGYDRIPVARDAVKSVASDADRVPDACVPEPCVGVLVNDRRSGDRYLCVRFSETAMNAGLGSPNRFVDADVLDDNGDGHSDLLLVRGYSKPSLFRNDGRGHFNEVTGSVGLGNAPASEGAAIGDFNGDGLPDIYFYGVKDESRWTEPGRGGVLYQSTPAGFVRVENVLSPADQRLESHAAVFVSGTLLFGTEEGLRAYQYESGSWRAANDLWNISDRSGEAYDFAVSRIDGRQHIYVANPTGANRHFILDTATNLYGRYEDALGTRAAGASVAAAWVAMNAGDTPSLFVGNYQGPNYVFLRDGVMIDGGIGLHFTDHARDFNLTDPGPTREIVATDTVGDGHPALFIARAQDPSISRSYPNLFYLPILGDDGRVAYYRDIATSLGIANPSRGIGRQPDTYGAVSTDLNGDGRQDLVVVFADGYATITGGSRVFMNETSWVRRCVDSTLADAGIGD